MDRRVRALRALEALLLGDDHRARAAVAAIDDWPLLFVRARRHAVAGHLGARLAELGIDPPADVARALARRDAEDELWFVHLAATLVELARGLAGAGVEYVALKGPALAVRIASPPHLRRSTDLDLLVAPGDLVAASEVASRLGYARLRGGSLRDHAATHLVHETLPGLELHHSAHVGIDRDVPASALLVGARDVEVLGTRVRAPAAAPELAYLALHAAGHRFERLAWLLDVARLLERGQASVDAAREVARGLGAGHALEVTLDEVARARAGVGRRGRARFVTLGEERLEGSTARATLNAIAMAALAEGPGAVARYGARKLRRDLAPRVRQALARPR